MGLRRFWISLGLLRSVDCRVGWPEHAVVRGGGDSNQITNGVMRRALRALAAQAMKGAAWERRGNPLRRASPGCAGFTNLKTLSETVMDGRESIGSIGPGVGA